MNNTIVAFLQNMWVYPRAVPSVARFGPVSDERERMIHYALFAGCLTGRRLKSTFGDLTNDIVWQEANPTVADNPKTYFPPDESHIHAVLQKHCPRVVICFTKAGESALRSILNSPTYEGVYFVAGIHPAARTANTRQTLIDLAKTLRAHLGDSVNSEPLRLCGKTNG